MKETDYYEEFCIRFSKYIESYLPKEISFGYSVNKTMDSMVKEIENKLGIKIQYHGYIPKLKLDILFAFSYKNKCCMVLFEGKYLRQLSLKDYSQLLGYLQVSQQIPIGILLLIKKGKTSGIYLSSDFNEILKLSQLPMKWEMNLENSNKISPFRAGILLFQPNNGIDWIDTNVSNGISSYVEMGEEIRKVLEY